MKTLPVNLLLGLVGALIGGLSGYCLFFWIARQGFYALILPGTCLGLGCGTLCRRPSQLGGILCGVSGLALGIWTEWQFAPFVKDESFSFFIAHLHELKPITLLMIALGGLFAYWFGRGRNQRDSRPRETIARE